jgi:hypothetical protein
MIIPRVVCFVNTKKAAIGIKIMPVPKKGKASANEIKKASPRGDENLRA